MVPRERIGRTDCFKSRTSIQRASCRMGMSWTKVGSSSTLLITDFAISVISCQCTFPLSWRGVTLRIISVETGRLRFTTLSVSGLASSITSKLIDETARAPNGYYVGGPETIKKSSRDRKKNKKAEEAVTREWHEGPPRVGTFSMRATRFRLRAGCLSWAKKDGTVAKNQRILDVIPAQFKHPAVNSTKGWRDLNKAELKSVNAGALKKPQLGPKDKRAANAAKEAEELQERVNGTEEGRQGERVEYTGADADEEKIDVPKIRSNVKDTAINIPRPSASIKQEEGTSMAGGHTYRQKSRKRLLEEDPGYSRDVEDDCEFRPSKKRRTYDLLPKSQGTGNGTIFAPHKLPKVRKPRHDGSRAPEPRQTAEQPALFSSPSDQHEQQSPRPYTVHSSEVLGAAMPPEPPFYGGHGRSCGNGQAYHSHVSNVHQDFNEGFRSNVHEDFDEWFRSEMQETQTYEYYGQDSLHNNHLQQSVRHQNEEFAQNSVLTGFHPGFAGVQSQGQEFGISHNVQSPPGAQYANFPSEFQSGSLPGSLPLQGYPQYGLAHEGFPQTGFYDANFAPTGFPQNDGFFGGSGQENSQQGWFSQYQTVEYQW